MIREEFGPQTVMVEVAQCESELKQYDDNGQVLVGVTDDIGVMQINPLWLPDLKRNGIDPYTLSGNIKAARYIYDRQGLQAWVCAKKLNLI